jgi:hypothetical protein
VLPYYDPFIVYGAWWTSYRPVYWRPWHVRPVAYRWYPQHYWHAQQPWRAPRPAAPAAVRAQSAPAISVQIQAAQASASVERQRLMNRPHAAVPEAQRRPIVESHVPLRVPEAQRQPAVQSRTPMPAAVGFSQHPRGGHVERREAHEHQRGNRRG